MSFNPDDRKLNTITLSNYEEYFILFMDNELSEQEKEMVMAFIDSHPELRSELDMLLSTKMPLDAVTIDKTSLLSDSMMLNTIDEELLLYLDRELSPQQEAAMINRLQQDAVLQLQWEQLQQTKLDPQEQIVFLARESLYRHTERRILTGWWRIAAIIFLLLFGGISYWLQTRNPAGMPSVAHHPSTHQPVRTQPTIQQQLTAVPSQQLIANQEKKSSADRINKLAAKKEPGGMAPKRDLQLQQPDVAGRADFSDKVNNSEPLIRKSQVVATPSLDGAVAKVDAAKNLNSSPVTSALLQPLDISQAGITSVEPEMDRNERRGNLKGFLRKASRMIGKRTGLGVASTDDESILVGAVELKLK